MITTITEGCVCVCARAREQSAHYACVITCIDCKVYQHPNHTNPTIYVQNSQS